NGGCRSALRSGSSAARTPVERREWLKRMEDACVDICFPVRPWDASTMRDVIRTRSKPLCILCGSPGTVLYQELRDRLYSAPGLWRLKQCSRPECGLVWSDPAPLEEDLDLA